MSDLKKVKAAQAPENPTLAGDFELSFFEFCAFCEPPLSTKGG